MRLAALASMSLFASASGDYVSMFVERGNVPAFPGTTTYRIFATFDDPGDKVIALAGLPPAFPLEFSTTGGSLKDRKTPGFRSEANISQQIKCLAFRSKYFSVN